MTYNVAVCDDDREFARTMSRLCTGTMEKLRTPFVLKTFNCEEEILRYISQCGRIDLLFLDIRLGRKSGIDLAKILKERGEEISVGLMSVDSSFLLEGYSVQPIYFLMKPIDPAELEKAVKINLKRRMSTQNVFIKCDRKQIPVPVESIQYIEVIDHLTTVHTKTQDYVSRTTFTELIDGLPQSCFARYHNSFAVNLARVTHFSRAQGVVLDCRVTLPIGRKYFDNLKKRFIEYVNTY